jgi:hypothetical protein
MGLAVLPGPAIITHEFKRKVKNMKKFLFSIMILSSASSVLFADEIYSKDSGIIKCEIIQITNENIEYRQEGKPFLTIPVNLVLKIVYANGNTVRMDSNRQDIIRNNSDIIYLKGGNSLECKILKVTQDVIIYNIDGSDARESIVRENVIKIIYASGQEERITEEEPVIAQPEESVIPVKGFIDSYIHLGLCGGFGFMWGDIERKEGQAYNRYKGQLTTYPVYPDDYDNSIYSEKLYGGFDIGLMLPAIKFQQDWAFGPRGIKFGITGNYYFSSIDQHLSDMALKDTNYSESLLEYRTVSAGPEMNLVLGPRSNNVNLVFRFYVTGGYIHKGELTAVPCAREAGLPLAESEYSTDFTGYSGSTGAGIRFVSNRGFPVIAGFDLQYTYSKIYFDEALPVYNNDKETSFSDIDIVISIGVHI